MYILQHTCISPQITFDNSFLEGHIELHVGNKYFAKEPNYSDLIPRGLLRRMGKAVRMGIGTGLPLVEKYKNLDGIILGSANGGLEDCLKFLNQIVQYEEGTLTPTNFVQSTPNAVAGLLALMSKNTGYNNTHVSKGLAFESALLDAILLFEQENVSQLLVGSVEEASTYNYNIDFLTGFFKEEEISSDQLLNSNTKGSVRGEGAAMFVVSNSKENALCEIVDVDQFTYPKKGTIEEKAMQFLAKNQLSPESIDALMLGFNGDNRSDYWYHDLMNSFNHSTVYTYKNLAGEYPTVSGFSLWLTSNILEGATIPTEVVYRDSGRNIQNMLIYNHYNDAQHGFILVKKV
jgi:hypothetical protein